MYLLAHLLPMQPAPGDPRIVEPLCIGLRGSLLACGAVGGQAAETVFTGFITLLVGLLLWLPQRGGRSRRLRQSIVNDLDLVGKLDGDRFAVAQQRLEWKTQFALEREYVPDPFGEARPAPQSRLSWAWWLTALVGFVVVVVVLGQVPERWWAPPLAGATAGTVASIVSTLHDRRRLRAEEGRLFLAFVKREQQATDLPPPPALDGRKLGALARLICTRPHGRR